MFLRLLLLLVGLPVALVASAQTPGPAAPATALATAAQPAPKRQLAAVRAAGPIKLDGVLDEPAWLLAPVATDFVEARPRPGRPEHYKTQVRILYTDDALYVGAILPDVSRDSVLHELSARDELGASDYFGIFLDPYQDQLNGYGFWVTPSGGQLDMRFSPAGGQDFNWNAVWDARTVLTEAGWVAELRIPYSAIRFSAAAEAHWGLNLVHQRKRENATFYWNEVKPAVDGFVNQWGVLDGLRDLRPPLRLSLTPYVSAYLNNNPVSADGQRRTTTRFAGGADVKWGINESFTLDATLVPDFGQVQSDNQVLNLSPFEVQFQENRQFFTEGTELFNKGGLFYSRRVGATPIGFYDVAAGPHEAIVSNPAETRLLNATKVSGRTRKGLGVGVFNAVSNNVYATLRDSATGAERQVLTQPLSNYNIVVLDQSLKNNSYVSLINTNVTRQGRTYDANVTSGLFRLATRANDYALDGQVVYSRRSGAAFGTETPVSDPSGYKYQLNAGKISGNFTWQLSHGIESNTYNPNDLGILLGNNNISQSLYLSYNKYQPFWKVNSLSTWANLTHSLLYRPTQYQNMGFMSGASTTFTRSLLALSANVGLNPATRDYYEPRADAVLGLPLGPYWVRLPGYVTGGVGLTTDFRKKLGLEASLGGSVYALDERLARPRRQGFGLTLAPRYRVSNRLNFGYSLNYRLSVNQIGYVNGGLDAQEPLDQPFDGQILLGRRRVATVTNVLQGAYTFTNRMSCTLRVRHYTSTVRYQDFVTLASGGQEMPADYRRNRDNTYNAFNVDAVYSWWFAPGSQLSVVYKSAATNSLAANAATPLYFDNLSNIINTPHNNSLSIKLLYYLDYLALRPRSPRS